LTIPYCELDDLIQIFDSSTPLKTKDSNNGRDIYRTDIPEYF
jgi:hypothetical protein